MSLISAKQLDLLPDHLTYGGTNSRQLRLKEDAVLDFVGGSITMDADSVLTLEYTPVASTDAVNKGYVDSVAQGLDIKESVRAISVAPITLSGEQTVDGVALVAGNRILVNGQADAEDNGIYVVAAGAWARSADADTSAEVDAGMFTFVTEGTNYADTGWVLSTDDAITLGTTELSFVQFSSAGVVVGGAGILKTGNTLSVELASASGLEFDAVGDGGKLQVASTIAGSGLAYASGVLSVNVTNGLEISGDDVQLASTAAGDGLSYTSGVLAVNVANGLEISGDNVQIASSAAGDGLSYTAGVLAVNTANGLEISGDNVQLASSVAGNGLAYNAGVLSVDFSELTDAAVDVSADSFLFIDASDSNASKKESIADLATAFAGAGLAATSGVLSVNVANGLEISGDNVQIASSAAGDGLSYTSGVLAVNVANGLEISGDNVQIASSAAGDGLSYTAGVLAVNVDDATIEISADTLRLKDGGIEAAKLGFTVKRVSVLASSFSYSSPISTFTVSVAPDTASQLVEMQELYRNGVADGVKSSGEPAADGEWRLNGTTLEIYGDVTASGDTYKVLYYS